MLSSLLQFVKLVLRLAPPLLWWALGGLAFSILNNVFHREFWPNTPLAQPVFLSLMLSCLLALPWLGACIAWRLAEAVESYFWKALWRFVAAAGYVGAALSFIGGMLAQGFMWREWISTH